MAEITLKKRRQIFLIILVVILFLSLSCPAVADPLESSLANQLEQLNLEQLTQFQDLIDPEYQQFLPQLGLKDILGRGEARGGLGDLVKIFIQGFFKEVVLSAHLLRQLVIVSLLSAILFQLQRSFGDQNTVNLAFMVTFLIITFICLQSFKEAAQIALTAVDNMVSFMHALLPTMATLLAAVGGISTAAIFHPVLIASVTTIASVVRFILFPLINIGVVLGLLAHLSPDFPLTKMAGFVRHLGTMLLSFLFVIFSSVLLVRGAIAPVADGLALRTAKFLTSTFVPVVGGSFAGAMEIVMGGSLLIKNAVGIYALVLLFFFLATPILKVWAIIIIYQIVELLIEPVCDKRFVELLGSFENALKMIMVSLATVSLMFFITVLVLVSFGNLAVFMR